MTITQISAWIMLVFCGLWAGGILIFAVERTNLWRPMPIDQYAIDFRLSLFRVDPMMPILGVIAGAATTIFAMHRSGAARDLAWTGLGFIVLVVMASITIAEPINSKFRRLPEGQTPQRAESDPLAAVSCAEKSRGAGSTRMPRGRSRSLAKIFRSQAGQEHACSATSARRKFLQKHASE
jgi:hypothetical protein